MITVYVSHSPVDSAGAELALIELVQGIAASGGIHLHVVVPAEGPLFRRLLAAGVSTSIISDLTWTDFPSTRSWPVTRLPKYVMRRIRSLIRMVGLLREFRCDVVVSNTSTVIIPALAAWIMRIPHVWYVHEFGREDHALRFDLGYERSMSLVGKLSDRVLVPSHAVSSALQQWIAEDQIRVVYCAVDGPLPLDPPAHDDTWRLVLVGRKSPGKGQLDAVNVVAWLRRRGQPVRLRLVGGGDADYIEVLRNRARGLGIQNYIEFVDHTPSVAPHYEWAHVALMCSRAEAFGRVTVEAMKFGRPVIGARAAGTAELIREGENGLMYEPGNVEDLGSKITQIASHPQRWADLTHSAQQWALELFSVERYVADFTDALKEALASREPGTGQ